MHTGRVRVKKIDVDCRLEAGVGPRLGWCCVWLAAIAADAIADADGRLTVADWPVVVVTMVGGGGGGGGVVVGYYYRGAAGKGGGGPSGWGGQARDDLDPRCGHSSYCCSCFCCCGC